MKKKESVFMRAITILTMVSCVAMFMTACGDESNKKTDAAMEVASEEVSPSIDISVIETGKEIVINDICKALDTYDTFNIQVPVDQLVKEQMQDGLEGLEFKTHTVVVADDTNSDGGKYDAVDTIVVSVSGADPYNVMAQTMEKTVEYKREVATETWVKTSEVCNKWDVSHKKLGGTCWKLSTDEGDTYIRLRDTIEFFYTKVDANVKSTEVVQFDTTILGAMATVKDGEMTMKRIHVLSGTVTPTGIITLCMETEDGDIEVQLNDYEKVEKTDMPFTEEEYKETADQR